MSIINRFVSAAVLSGVFLLGSGPLVATTYYVSTSGNDSSSGTTTAVPWRTFGKAVTTAKAGDTVYIKAGLYVETAGVLLSNSGTAALPIVFEGYKTTPGDRPTYPGYTPGNDLNTTEIPVLRGASDTASSYYVKGIQAVGKNYITFRNLGISYFFSGLVLDTSAYHTLDHVFIDACASDGLYPTGSSYFTLTNCTVADSGLINFSFWKCHHCTLTNCKAYSADYSLSNYSVATDYYFYINYGQNNTITNCTTRNYHYLQTGTHPGHAFGIKDDPGASGTHSYGNVFSGCIAYNHGEHFFASHLSHDNTFVNCKGYADYPNQMTWCEGLVCRDGAYNNTFTNCRMVGSRFAIELLDTTEGATNQITSGNTFTNCIFGDNNVGIGLFSAQNNTIKNCVFNDSAEWTFLRLDNYEGTTTQTSSDNTFRNSIVVNCNSASTVWSSGTAGSIASFTYSDFHNNRFSMPSGTGNIAQDPLFADAANGDYHLKSTGGRWNPATSSWVTDTVTSPCIDAGNPSDSYALEPAPNGGRINMGAYGNTTEASKTGRSVVRPPTRIPYSPSRR